MYSVLPVKMFCCAVTMRGEPSVQITLTYDGVTIYGTATELTRYPDVTRVGSIVILGQLAYFSGTPSTLSKGSMTV